MKKQSVSNKKKDEKREEGRRKADGAIPKGFSSQRSIKHEERKTLLKFDTTRAATKEKQEK